MRVPVGMYRRPHIPGLWLTVDESLTLGGSAESLCVCALSSVTYGISHSAALAGEIGGTTLNAGGSRDAEPAAANASERSRFSQYPSKSPHAKPSLGRFTVPS